MYDSVFRCSVIKVLFLLFCCAVFPAPALLYYHTVYALVNNFFHFFYSFFLERKSKNKIYVRNIAKDVSHLKRVKKDAYKIIIRCLYPVIEKYPNIKKEFRKKFIIIRCNEIDYLSNIEKHEEIENSIQNIAEKYLDKLAMDSNSENNKNFKTILKDFFLYKERI